MWFVFYLTFYFAVMIFGITNWRSTHLRPGSKLSDLRAKSLHLPCQSSHFIFTLETLALSSLTHTLSQTTNPSSSQYSCLLWPWLKFIFIPSPHKTHVYVMTMDSIIDFTWLRLVSGQFPWPWLLKVVTSSFACHYLFFVLLKTYLACSVLILMIIVYDIRTMQVLTFGKTYVRYKYLPWVKRRYKTSTYPCIVDSIRQKPRKQIKIWQLVWDWYRELVYNWYLFDNLCYRNTGCTEKLSYDSYNTKPRTMAPSAFHRSDLVLKFFSCL